MNFRLYRTDGARAFYLAVAMSALGCSSDGTESPPPSGDPAIEAAPVALDSPEPADDEAQALAVDDDGVQKLFPSASSGSSFRLGTKDPNDTEHFIIEKGATAKKKTDGAIKFWNIPSYEINYSSGGSGWTSRLHVQASGGSQKYTWKNQNGYLSSSKDLRNQEFTVYARIHTILDAPRAAVALKVRGGKHSSSDADLASCIMMEFSASGRGFTARFGKELSHPTYDYVKLSPAFSSHLSDNAWIGLKMVSYASPSQPGKVTNRLYLDTDPFDRSTGRPKNGWRLFSEYIDEEGKSTGKYKKLVDWGGWQTTFRTDGIKSLDFAIVSMREIVPPS